MNAPGTGNGAGRAARSVRARGHADLAARLRAHFLGADAGGEFGRHAFPDDFAGVFIETIDCELLLSKIAATVQIAHQPSDATQADDPVPLARAANRLVSFCDRDDARPGAVRR